MHSDYIYSGDVLDVLPKFPDNYVQCVVTSPPYWGLRDYGISRQIGLEKTPKEFIEKMVSVFREIKRVLKKDGTLWLNLGDSYVGGGRYGSAIAGDKQKTNNGSLDVSPSGKVLGLKSKDMVGIPWRVALALQSDGWYLRSDIIWSKPNPMPESVKDRPTKSHEYLFLLSKSEKYFYNADAIAEPASLSEIETNSKTPRGWDTGEGSHRSLIGNYKNLPEGQSNIRKIRDKQRGHSRKHSGFNDRWDAMEKEGQCSGMRNKRSVWNIATSPYADAHFATFPEDIPELCIKAGTKPNDFVLDPFMGSGTTAVVAKRFNRRYLGIELNREYIKMAETRIGREHPPLLTEV